METKIDEEQRKKVIWWGVLIVVGCLAFLVGMMFGTIDQRKTSYDQCSQVFKQGVSNAFNNGINSVTDCSQQCRGDVQCTNVCINQNRR